MTENANPGAGILELGGDLRVNRLGFGAMRLCGPGVWGEPEDPRAQPRWPSPGSWQNLPSCSQSSERPRSNT